MEKSNYNTFWHSAEPWLSLSISWDENNKLECESFCSIFTYVWALSCNFCLIYNSQDNNNTRRTWIGSGCFKSLAPCQLCTFWKILAYCILSFYFFFFFSFMYFTLSKINVWNIDLVVIAKLWHFYSCNFHANSLGILNRLKNTLIFCPWDIQCIVTPKWTFRLVLAQSEWSSWSSHQSNK